jgi:NAD(P)-dependent dehydrogenase (short-subunit alcohol dehydrogenase family)
VSIVLIMSRKWTASDVPDQSGRVAIVTGSNTGIGYGAAAVLADKGAHVVLAVRNVDKGNDAKARITASSPNAVVTVQELDLTSLASIRKAADELRAAHPRIDLLINNAGVMYTDKASTKDGFELQFGTNHLGHFALTGQLLDNMLPVDGSRVVTISSVGHRIRARIHFEDLQLERNYDRVALRAVQAGNLLFTYELARRLKLKGVPTGALAAHPGAATPICSRNMPGGIRQVSEFFWTNFITAPMVSVSSVVTRKSLSQAHNRTTKTSSAGCGAFPKSSPTSRIRSDAMRSVEEHRRVVAGLITPRPPVGMPLADTLGLVLAEDVVAPLSLPGFDNSAMDGYAVVADDIAGASAEQPVLLPVAEDIPAGRTDLLTLKPCTATGRRAGPVRATAVVPVEPPTARRTPCRSVRPRRPSSTPPRRRGRHRGTTVLRAGQVVTPAAYLAAALVPASCL